MAHIIFTEGSGLQNSIFGKCQYPIRAFLEARGEAFEQESIASKIFNMETSKNFGEMFGSMTGMDGFSPVGENGDYPMDGMQESFRKFLEHMVWKDSFALSREIIDDNKILDLKGRPAAFIKGYYRTREMFGAALLGSAIQGQTYVNFRGRKFDSSCADDLCLFSTAHPSKLDSSMTQSNCFADDFSADALGEVETAMQNFAGDNGEILDVAPDTIIIPNSASLKNAVFAAIGADKSPETANNGFNYQYGRWNVIVWPYLNKYITAGTAPWILMDSNYNETNKSAVWLDRVNLEVSSKIADNDANVWKGYARFIAGFNDFRGFAIGGVSGGTQLISA